MSDVTRNKVIPLPPINCSRSSMMSCAAQHKVEAELVKLRYFVGMTNDEAADVLGLSPRTAKYYWTHARAWLYREIDSQRQTLALPPCPHVA